MFNGIIDAIGVISGKDLGENGALFTFSADKSLFDFSTIKIGESIAIDGVCLTAIEVGADYFKAELSQETLNCSIFAQLKINDKVNMEKSLRLGQGIDGHLLSGHTDGIGAVIDCVNVGQSKILKISVAHNLVKYIAKKGSICVNGVSLTVNTIADSVFAVNIVPHTLKTTNLGLLKKGDRVNLEVDMIARYIEQLLKKMK